VIMLTCVLPACTHQPCGRLSGEFSPFRTNAESEWHRRCESEGYVDPPERLEVVRERITEARRMLTALNARFPRA
jgi:hypothetical protein